MRKLLLVFALIGALYLLAPSPVTAAGSTQPLQIGILIPESDPNETQTLNGFRDGLRKLGYREGDTIRFDIRDAKGERFRLKPLAKELAAKKVDLIFTTGTRATRAAIGATKEIPIIFQHPADPVELGFVKNMNKPGTNVTGVAALALAATGKRLAIFKDIVPGLRRVYVFYYANDRYAESNFNAVEQAAAELKIDVADRGIKGVDELKRTFRGLQKRDGDAIFHMPDDLVESESKFIFDEAKKQKLATMYHDEIWATMGSLAAYGPNYFEMGRQAAQLAQKIFKGANPKDLPVERASKFDLVINLRTASIIGRNISSEVMKKADRVIR